MNRFTKNFSWHSAFDMCNEDAASEQLAVARASTLEGSFSKVLNVLIGLCARRLVLRIAVSGMVLPCGGSALSAGNVAGDPVPVLFHVIAPPSRQSFLPRVASLTNTYKIFALNFWPLPLALNCRV